MATQNGVTASVETWVRGSLEGAQARLTSLEKEAGKVLRNFAQHTQVQELSRTAQKAGNEMRKRLDGLQTRVAAAAGVASQAQVEELNRELARLAKKIDALVSTRKGGKNGARA